MVGIFATDVVATPEVVKKEIIGPWLTERNLVLLYGPRGSGKSNIALGIAHAASTQSYYLRPKWRPWRPYRAIYFDSELGVQAWRKKLLEVDSASQNSLSGENLKFVTPECMNNGSPWNISDPEIQRIIELESETFDLVIFDNLIDFTGKLSKFDGELEIWRRVEGFLKRLRDRGQSVIVVHHAGKSGDQLGTIEHEKPMDTVIKLMPVADPKFQGMKCDLHFTKARWFFGTALEPLRVEYEKIGDKQAWRAITLKEAKAEWAKDKKASGWSMRDIAKAMNLSESELKEITGDIASPFYGPQYGSQLPQEDDLGII
jgi:hypothetical protein